MTRGTETGDRAAFLARLRAQLADGVPANHAHPAPAPRHDAPAIVHLAAGDDLEASFEQAATEASASVHLARGGVGPGPLLDALIDRLGIQRAVVTNEPEVEPFAVALAARGIEVGAPTRDACESADLGVTSAMAAIAATGSVVIDTSISGRVASLLPRIHLCVVPRSRVVRDPSAVLRVYTGRPDTLPSQLVVITGPSRTGDIEQLLTLGVHGPLELHIALVDG